ncbi:hypothetical protein, partial [Bradyrhizobium guangdongense]|uniref:hypothetical protein n=1 Tax=Bradyrhizobium guangdongense TaxID=1325090 RepID=UPI001FDA3715
MNGQHQGNAEWTKELDQPGRVDFRNFVTMNHVGAKRNYVQEGGWDADRAAAAQAQVANSRLEWSRHGNIGQFP